MKNIRKIDSVELKVRQIRGRKKNSWEKKRIPWAEEKRIMYK